MKKELYSCEGGCICVGTPEARANYLNGFGDGTFTVKVCTRAEFRRFRTDKWEFQGAVEGPDIRVFDCDYLTTEAYRDDKHVLFKLSGRFGIYANIGDIVLERWE